MMFAICCSHFCGLVFALASHILSEPTVGRSLTDLDFSSHDIDGRKVTILLCQVTCCIDCQHSSNMSTNWSLRRLSSTIFACFVISFCSFCNKFFLLLSSFLIRCLLSFVVFLLPPLFHLCFIFFFSFSLGFISSLLQLAHY
jgi:hypothetical protein